MQHEAIEVIRHSLAAANAALGLLDTPAVEVQEQAIEVQSAHAPTYRSTCVQEPAQTLAMRLLEELETSRFNLRTEAELMNMFGIQSSRKLHEALDDMDEDYTTRTRNADKAPLVGLSSRN